MRMRKKKHANERVQACTDYIRWSDMFENKNGKPVHIEIGCGKGDFICGMAVKFPEINFIAVEKNTDVLVIAIEKTKSLNLSNVRFIISDAKKLADYFEADKISCIYLNFSDPWHKRYQHINRLTHQSFLDVYKKFLTRNAKIIMKTDNTNLFNFSVISLPLNGFEIINKTYDLYSSNFLNGNIQTEYEKKFVEQNIPICYLEAIFSSVL